jgi:Ricin-type beta-trefoil lectin domain-like
LVQPGRALSGQQIASGGVSYYIIAPVGQSGIAFMGDLGKFVSNGRKRIASVTDQSGQLTANVLFAPTESQVTLHGYSGIQPVVTVQAGAASPVSYNPVTGHFAVVITVSPNAPLNNDIDPASNVIVTFKTSNATAATSTYALIVNSTGMALTPSGGGTANDTPLVQQPYTGTIAQLWNVNSLGNGRYDAIGVASGRSINVQGGPGATSPGTIIQLYDYKTESNQWFTLAPAGGNCFSVLFVNSGLAMTVSGASTAAGASIVQQPSTGGTNQQWSFQSVPQSGSTYHLICKTSGMALDNSGSTSNGTPVKQWTDMIGNSNQEWRLVSIGNGYFNLICQRSGLALDNSGSTSNGGAVWQWTPQSGNANQMWRWVSVGDGNYNLICATGGMALGNRGSTSIGTAVQQWTPVADQTNQEWSFEFIR